MYHYMYITIAFMIDEWNIFNCYDFFSISINKKFMPHSGDFLLIDDA
jgi:hypothetical protein